ncbi:TetR/AcrR family transcriptional regulator [Streptomyces sp. NPDC007088]|uniref:TetR/AcrR family transcriptional regulator n=1 Tax=Streptomyces sp. NPDC007088 TaxID=3364773 RepID=UPI0036CA52BF
MTSRTPKATAPPRTPSSPRDRYREQTRAEIKQTALAQLAEGGVEAVALTRIAKAMGLSGPALYRYFAGRDELLSALIRDAYDDAAAAVETARQSCAGRPAAVQLTALADAFRAWALAQPHRYLLIAGSPVAGYQAPPDTVDRARGALGPFVGVLATSPRPAAESGADAPLIAEMSAWAAATPAVREWAARYTGAEASPEAVATGLAGALLAWAQVHGTVSLEVTGQFTGMGHDPAALLHAQTEALAERFRLARE